MQAHIELHSFVVPETLPDALPTVSEQARVAAVYGAHVARTRAQEQELSKLSSLKSALMHDLLTGRVRTIP